MHFVITIIFHTASLSEASSQIQGLVPDFVSLIVTGLSQLCMQNLESANTLPRLYRRTNKEVNKFHWQ